MTSSGNNYSRKFHGTMTLPGIYELHKLNIWQEKKIYTRKIISC